METTLVQRVTDNDKILYSLKGESVFNMDHGNFVSEFKVLDIYLDKTLGLNGNIVCLCDHRQYSSSGKPKKWNKNVVFPCNVILDIYFQRLESI